jgi:hypothetical protein
MESLYIQGVENYENINYKLLALTDIRDNVIDNIKNDMKVLNFFLIVKLKCKINIILKNQATSNEI